MENVLKEIFGPIFEAMLNGEMNSHLGYENNSKSKKNDDHRRNGYSEKTLKTTGGKSRKPLKLLLKIFMIIFKHLSIKI